MSNSDPPDDEKSPRGHLESAWEGINSAARSVRSAIYAWLRRRGYVVRGVLLFGGSLVVNELVVSFIARRLPAPNEISFTVPEISNTFVAVLVVFVSLANWILIRRNLNIVRNEISSVSNSASKTARADGGDGAIDWPAFLIGAGLGGLIATEFAPDFVIAAALIGGFLALQYFPENG